MKVLFTISLILFFVSILFRSIVGMCLFGALMVLSTIGELIIEILFRKKR